MEEKNVFKKLFDRGRYALKRVFDWIKRAFFRGKGLDVPLQTETPSHLLRKAFFAKKSAVVALVLLISLFAFVFIAPIFTPMDVNFTDALSQNVAPVFSLRKVPKALKNEVQSIEGFSGFTAGLSKDGTPFVWGSVKDGLTGQNYARFPEQLKGEKVAFLSAGKDHLLAITQSGKLVGWGDKSCGQYGFEQILNALPTPEVLRDGIAPERVRSLLAVTKLPRSLPRMARPIFGGIPTS